MSTPRAKKEAGKLLDPIRTDFVTAMRAIAATPPPPDKPKSAKRLKK